MTNPDQTTDTKLSRTWRINLRHTGILYGRECRAALRDKSVVINSILIPIFLYPFILWAALSLLVFIRGQSETAVAKVGISAWMPEHPGLRRALEQNENLVIIGPANSTGLVGQPRNDLAGRIREQEFDIFIEFHPRPKIVSSELPAFEAHITYDQTLNRSASAHRRVASILEDYRENWVRREAGKRGIAPAEWHGFGITLENIASRRQMGSFVLGLTLPIIFTVMVAMGCFYPAVDTLAGERERGTWETLMSTAAQRNAILLAKYLHVVTFGGIAGTLNLAAVLLTIKPIMQVLSPEAGQGIELASALQAAPLMLSAALLLAGFIAAGMMVFAAFARTFKEGQAMITPFYLVVLVPVIFLQVPGIQLSVETAWIPVVNLILMMRAALGGVFEWLPILITFVASLAAIALALGAAAYVLKFEEIVTGSYKGSVLRFARSRFIKRNNIPGGGARSHEEVSR
jgi:sodium transport system permease protein